MRIGEIEVLPVFDGLGYEVARDVLLRPDEDGTDPWAAHEARLDPHGRLEFTLGGFLVRTGDRVIVVDAGAGTIDTGQYRGGQFLASLHEHGVAPDDVTDVIFTHLHFDHVGWATAKGEVVFRHATYRVHEADWAYFVDSPGALPGRYGSCPRSSRSWRRSAPGARWRRDSTPGRRSGTPPARRSTSCPAAPSGPCCSATWPTRRSS
jgi:glyoxylase-like metal-dependent hydrolase (beta-lactamase superfamily II)